MNDTPLLSPGFLKWIEMENFSTKSILEIGSGNSTLFFSKHFKNVYSYEDDEEWINTIKLYNLPNISIELFDVNIFDNLNFKNKIFESDVILIDNNPNNISREDFVFFIHEHKNPNSIIILDNGDWNYVAYEFLRNNYYCYDFIRNDERENYEITQTSVFYHPRIKIKRTFSLI